METSLKTLVFYHSDNFIKDICEKVLKEDEIGTLFEDIKTNDTHIFTIDNEEVVFMRTDPYQYAPENDTQYDDIFAEYYYCVNDENMNEYLHKTILPMAINKTIMFVQFQLGKYTVLFENEETKELQIFEGENNGN